MIDGIWPFVVSRPPNPYEVAAVVLAIGALVVWLRSVIGERGRPVQDQRSRNVLALTLGVFAMAGSATSLVRPGLEWAWVLAWLPAAMIIDHAAFLAMVRKAHFPGDSKDTLLAVDGQGDRREASEAVLAQARSARDSYFGLASLALRYGLPALLIVAIGTLAAYILCAREPACCVVLEHDTLVAARLGLAGAYVYVLLYLGQRTVRHDITSGAAMWSATTLALGPLLAVVLSILLTDGAQVRIPAGQQPEAVDAATDPSPAGDPAPKPSQPSLSHLAIYFLAGLSPRYIATFVEETVRRLLGGSNTNATVQTVPLTHIRGISREIEERLAEVGILDAYALAMADPFKILRSTNFDKRQVLDWIDQALLIRVLPEAWGKLASVGVTGAIDLAWLHVQEPEAAEVQIDALASLAGIDKALLRGVIKRLWEDMQVLIVWTLYQVASEGDETVAVLDGRASPPNHPGGGGPDPQKP